MLTSLKNKAIRLPIMITVLALCGLLKAQSTHAQSRPDSTWIGQRVIMLKGRGEANSPDKNGVIHTSQLPNIVVPVARIDGNKIWVLAPGEIEPGSWVDMNNIILLTGAIPYFDLLIKKNPEDWDTYFRKADAEHALNKRDEAISDYSTAINLHPNDTYLYFRRARSYQARQLCIKAIADYGEVIRISPNSSMAADAYSRQASLYANCGDSLQRNPQKAVAAAQMAVSLDSTHPTYLTILASAYARNGQLEEAIAAQRKALDSRNFPPGPGYRPDAIKYLKELEQALAEKRIKK
ncbi:MAG: tetratricopeptide repeat protein [Bacteroidota bacterium]